MLEYKEIREKIEASLRNNQVDKAMEQLFELDSQLYPKLEYLKKLLFINEELLENKEFFRLLTENSSDFIALHHSDGTFLYTSPSVNDILGYDINELVGKNPYDYFHPDEIQRITNNHKQLLENGKTDPIEFRFKSKNGQYIWLESSLKTVYNSKNELIQIIAINRDIHERMQAEIALQKSEEKFRFLTENTMDVIWVLDIESMNYTYISPSIEKLTGFTANEILLQPFINSISSNSIQFITDTMGYRRKIFLSNPLKPEIYYDELEQPCKNGKSIWIEVISYFRVNPENQRLEIIGTNRDITDRRNTQTTLKQIRERLKILTDITIEGVIILDKGKIIDVNPSAEKLFELDSEQLIGSKITNFVQPEFSEIVEKYISEKNSARFEVFLKRNSGALLPVEIETTSYKLGNKPVKVIALRNITDRKKTEDLIRKLTAAINQSPAAIVITNKKGDIEYVNPYFTKITGYSSDEVLGKNPRILKSGKVKSEVYSDLWETILQGNTWKGELLNRKKDGSLFWEMATIAPILNEKGNIINYVAIKEDITQRKKEEQSFLHTQKKLEEANATKDKFFSIIAHDLKNPFNIILGFSDLLLQNHKEYDVETRESVIKTIYEISLKTFNLLENLLAWSRSKSGSISYNPKILDIRLIAYDSISLFNEAAEKKSIKLHLDATDDYSIWADRDMVAAVIRNLINNGIKFTPRNGKISVFINQINAKFIEISVKDSGIGIRKEKLDILFNIDRDWNTPGTEDEAGTGLGLILCKEFVEKNGGTIKVESEVGVGTIFSFTVPLAE